MIRTQNLKHLPGSAKGRKGGGEGDVRRGAEAREAVKKSRDDESLRR